MPHFRRKPIAAIQWIGTNWAEVRAFIGPKAEFKGNLGSYVIKKANGKVKVIPQEIFEAQYEPAETPKVTTI